MIQDFNQCGLILAAAGSSKRFGKQDKLLIAHNKKPLFLHAFETFSEIIPIENIIVVVSPGQEEKFAKIIQEHTQKKPTIIAGGAERSLSVLSGLKKLPQNIEFAAVHDAARPFLKINTLKACLKQAIDKGSAVLAKPVSDTIKIVDDSGKVLQTPNRETLKAAETPQIFSRKKLICAYEKALKNHPAKQISDESTAMEMSDEPVFLFIHEENNSKITYAYDAESL